MGLHIEIRFFYFLQNILPGLHPHIVDVDVHDREHGLQDLRKREVVKVITFISSGIRIPLS